MALLPFKNPTASETEYFGGISSTKWIWSFWMIKCWLLSNHSDNEALDQFANTIREMKNNGVRFEVCDYALKVMGVDPNTMLPEINHVANGFISIAGYQAQGYSTITIN